jgi:hypothetical protein
MVVGDDVEVGAIPDLLGKMMVEHFIGKVVSPTSLKGWLEEKWVQLLGYFPTYHMLARGWISFQFKRRKDLETIFNKDWGWGPSGLILKEWDIMFDPLKESQTPTKIWAILPNLPLFFWNEIVFKSIGNKLGMFLSCEPRWEMKVDRWWVWVQISVDLKEGLTDEIELVWGNFNWIQKIDYWHVFPLDVMGVIK